MDNNKSYLEKLKENSSKYSSNFNNTQKHVHLPSILPSQSKNERPYKNIENCNIDLMTMMSKRLKVVEKKCRVQEEELANMKSELCRIKEQLEGTTQERNNILDKYNEVKQQIDEMEIFLADYGLIWVGDGGEKRGAINSPPEILDDDYYDNLITALSRINESLFSYNLDNVPIYIYSNGIKLDSMEFKSFHEPEMIEFVSEVTEGYYPSEMQKIYYNGCTFDIFDRRNFLFNKNEVKSNIVSFSNIEDKNSAEFNPLLFRNKIHMKKTLNVDNEQKNNKLFFQTLSEDQIAIKVSMKFPKSAKFLIFLKNDKMNFVVKSILYECKLNKFFSMFVFRVGKLEPSEKTLQEIGINFSTVVHVFENRKSDPLTD